MNNLAYKQGNSLGEIKTDFLISLQSYSISEPMTLKRIIELSVENRNDAIQTIFITDLYRDKLERISWIDSKFKKSLAFIDFVRKTANDNNGSKLSDQIQFISENLDLLVSSFETDPRMRMVCWRI